MIYRTFSATESGRRNIALNTLGLFYEEFARLIRRALCSLAKNSVTRNRANPFSSASFDSAKKKMLQVARSNLKHYNYNSHTASLVKIWGEKLY